MEWCELTSRKNETVLLAASLSEKKQRRKTASFCFEGAKLLGEALTSGVTLRAVFATEKARAQYADLLAGIPDSVRKYAVTDEVYRKFSEENAPQGIFCIAEELDKSVKITTIYMQDQNDPSQRMLLCDGMRDPGNVGTVIRCAAAMGVGRLVFSSDCADLYHPKTVRGAMGALFRQHIDLTDDMEAYVRSLREGGRRVFAAALRDDAKTLGTFPLLPTDCFLVGNEGHGLSDALCSVCDGAVKIPMEPGNESYNAAMAATLLMWEGYRQSLS